MAAMIIVVQDGDVVLKGVTQENYMWFAKKLLSVSQGLMDAEFEEETQDIPQVQHQESTNGDEGWP